MSTPPNTQPLAALLASHPEECAAVVAVLARFDPGLPVSFAGVQSSADHYAPGAMVKAGTILDIGVAEGWIRRNMWGEYNIDDADRYAIARMGAAAWLAARVAPCG